MTLQELKARKIGLVLAGGGAKGAYQIGCWKALRDRGLGTFSAVSGTSVGALNAMLIALDKFDEAVGLWADLKVRTVIGIKPLAFLFFPIWFVSVIHRTLFAPNRAAFRELQKFVRAIQLWTIAILLFAIPNFYPDDPDAYDSGVFYAIFFLLLLFGAEISAIVLRFGFTTNSPLSLKVHTVVSESEFANLRIPVYATLSRFRPDLRIEASAWQGWIPEYVKLNSLKWEAAMEVILQSAGLPGIFPVQRVLGWNAIDGGWCDNVPVAPLYLDPGCDVDLILVIFLDTEGRRRGTFNFPFGRVANATGGWTDTKGRIVIPAQATTHWNAAQRVNDPLEFFPPAIQVLNDGDDDAYEDAEKGPLVNPGAIEVERREPKVLVLTPSESLGDFRTGTLNFSASKAKQLMALGEQDMVRLIDKVLASQDLPEE